MIGGNGYIPFSVDISICSSSFYLPAVNDCWRLIDEKRSQKALIGPTLSPHSRPGVNVSCNYSLPNPDLWS